MDTAHHLIDLYGYWAVFIWTFIEGESVFIAAAALAAAGIMEPWKVIMAAAGGAFLGHLVFFALGRWRGMQIIRAVPFLYKHYPKANKILDHYAHWSIFIFQYLYGTRLISAIMFGCSSIDFKRFFFLQIINCLSWAFVIYLGGHLLGLAAIAIMNRFGVHGLVVTVVAITLLIIAIYFKYAHHHVVRKLSDDDNGKTEG
jgi:membrane-associated protein